SPTMPTRSPGAMSKETFLVACQTPCEVLKRMPRPRTDSSGGDAAPPAELTRCGLRASITLPLLPTAPQNDTGPRRARLLVFAKDRPQVSLRQAEISFRVSE